MLLRAVAAFLVLPGIVALTVPMVVLWASGKTVPVHPWGLVLIVLGLGGLLWCVRAFYVHGKGTLAPWSPPVHLVARGLYGWSRNPMYVSVVTLLVGWALTFGSTPLGVYAAVVAVVFHLRVVWFEEPWLARAFPGAWPGYRDQVPRWLGPVGARRALPPAG